MGGDLLILLVKRAKDAMVLLELIKVDQSQLQVNPGVFPQNPKLSLPPYSPSSDERSSGTVKCHWSSKERLFLLLYPI